MSRCLSCTALAQRRPIFTDPNVAMFKARQFGEVLATDLVRRGRVRVDGDRQVDRLRALDREGFLHGRCRKAFDHIRGVGNRAVHWQLSGLRTIRRRSVPLLRRCRPASGWVSGSTGC